jgi:hypothetical protein
MNRYSRAGRMAGTLVALLAATTLFGARPAWCWDKYAHEIIAQIAYDRLTPTAKAAADGLISKLASDPDVVMLPSKYKPYNFVTAAAWMDDMRPSKKQPEGTREFSTWHYIDLPLDPNLTADGVRAYRDGNTSNAYLTIENFCIPTLQNASAPESDRARALGFLLHLAGDITQPLHCAGPEAGGNTHAIAELPSADPDWPVKNLHAFWDGAYRYTVQNGQIVLADTSDNLPRIAAPGQDPVASDAKAMMAQYAPTDQTQIADLDPADWALESNKVATSFAYPDAGSALTGDYVTKAHDIACRRLTLAGVRLAALLNKLLGS